VSRQTTTVLAVLSCTLVLARAAAAQEDASPPVPLASLKDKPGGRPATLAERSPLSVDLREVARQPGLPVAPPAPSGGRPVALHPPAVTPATNAHLADVSDYDLAAARLDAYVPAAPADDGRFGVMVGQSFAGLAEPPMAWTAVLEAPGEGVLTVRFN
jgi:hypothetical protein